MSGRQKGEKNLPAPRKPVPHKDRPQNQKGAKRGKPNSGRPLASGSLLEQDPKLIEKICAALRIGSHIDTACAIHGVGYSTMREWVLKGKENPDSIYGEFTRAVEKAVSEAETRDLAVIEAFAVGRAAEYQMEPVMVPLEKDGVVMFHPGTVNPIMVPLMTTDPQGNKVPVQQIARDADGNPILKRAEVKPQWQAAAWKLERRRPLKWGRFDRVDVDHRHLNPEKAPDASSGASPSIPPEEHLRRFNELADKIRILDELKDDPDA